MFRLIDHSSQVMAATASCFGFNVICIFSLYNMIRNGYESDSKNVMYNLVLLLWNLYYLSLLLLIIHVGSALSKEVNIDCMCANSILKFMIDGILYYRVG